MKICNRCHAEKPLSEFHKRSNRPSGHVGVCKSCKTEEASDYRERNAEVCRRRSLDYFYRNVDKFRVRAREWHQKNPEASKRLQKRWIEENRPYRAAKFKEWAAANSEKIKRNGRNTYLRNPVRARIAAGKRRALKLRAVPIWADPKLIGAVYKEARERTLAAGVKYVVDHVVPLKSKLVCGLHVQDNLRVIPHADNAAKSNKYWPHMPMAA